MGRAIWGLLIAILVVVVAANVLYRVKVDTHAEPGNEAWTQNRMQFVAWNDEQWTAWVYDGAFELVPQNNDKWSRHSSPSIAFIHWDGDPWQARIDGDEFVLARRGDWQQEPVRSPAIRYRDWLGNKQLRTVADLRG